MGDEDPNLERWMLTTAKLFGTVERKLCQPNCICIVPNELRKRNGEAYEPKVVSIGPRYKGRRELLAMEEIKWHCIMSFLYRKEDGSVLNTLKSCIQQMLEFDLAVRASYGEEIKLDSDVQVLKNKGIIVDQLGMNNHDLVDLFRCIANGIDRGLVDSRYGNMIDELNNYSARNCVVRFPVIAWHSFSRISEWLYGLGKFFGSGYNFAVSLLVQSSLEWFLLFSFVGWYFVIPSKFKSPFPYQSSINMLHAKISNTTL
ncbi:hypothetical protein CR513_10760, partial [Mucuna pruriens]